MVYNTEARTPGLRINPSPADCVDWKAQNHVFSDMAILDCDIDPVLSQVRMTDLQHGDRNGTKSRTAAEESYSCAL